MMVNIGGRNYVRVIPPNGCDTANHGTECFTVEDDGSMLVSAEAVESLCRVAGFLLAPDDAPAPPAAVSTYQPPSPVDAALAEAHATPTEVAAIIAEIESLHRAPLTLAIPG